MSHFVECKPGAVAIEFWPDKITVVWATSNYPWQFNQDAWKMVKYSKDPSWVKFVPGIMYKKNSRYKNFYFLIPKKYIVNPP